jgi:hypothetical protein
MDDKGGNWEIYFVAKEEFFLSYSGLVGTFT